MHRGGNNANEPRSNAPMVGQVCWTDQKRDWLQADGREHEEGNEANQDKLVIRKETIPEMEELQHRSPAIRLLGCLDILGSPEVVVYRKRS
jgi:hypothetical protein